MSGSEDKYYNDLVAELLPPPMTDLEAFLDCARYNDDGDADQLRAYLNKNPKDINAQDSQGRTAVHMAAANGHMPILEMLFEFGPTPNIPNYEGNTALHFAALNNHVETARRLLRNGWSVSTCNASGRTSLQLIQEKQFGEMETLLIEHDETLDNYVPPTGSSAAVATSGEAESDSDDGDTDGVDQAKGATTASATATSASKPKAAVKDMTTGEAMLGSANVDGIE